MQHPEKMTKQVLFRLTERELLALRIRAAAEQRTVSALVRLLCKKGLKIK